MITTKPAPASRCSVLRQSRLSCLHASDELIPRGHGPDPADLACRDQPIQLQQRDLEDRLWYLPEKRCPGFWVISPEIPRDSKKIECVVDYVLHW